MNLSRHRLARYLPNPVVVLVFLTVFSPRTGLAATVIVVNSTAQEAVADTPNGVTNGNCTLGEAIRAANNNSSVDGCQVAKGGPPFVIVLPVNSTFTLTLPHNFWYGPNALPAIASTIVIDGQGAVLKIPNADDAGNDIKRLRFFYVGADPNAPGTPGFNTPGAGNLTLLALTLTGGRQHGGDSGQAVVN